MLIGKWVFSKYISLPDKYNRFMSRLRYLVVIYFWFVLVFVLQKPLFMFWQGDLYAGISFLDWLRVMWHGLPLDLSVSAYIMVLPMLLATVSICGTVRLLGIPYRCNSVVLPAISGRCYGKCPCGHVFCSCPYGAEFRLLR